MWIDRGVSRPTAWITIRHLYFEQNTHENSLIKIIMYNATCTKSHIDVEEHLVPFPPVAHLKSGPNNRSSWPSLMLPMFGSNPSNLGSNLNRTCPNRYLRFGSDGFGWVRFGVRPLGFLVHACEPRCTRSNPSELRLSSTRARCIYMANRLLACNQCWFGSTTKALQQD